MRKILFLVAFLTFVPIFTVQAVTCPASSPGINCYNNTYSCGGQCISQSEIDNIYNSLTCPAPTQIKNFSCDSCSASCACPSGQTLCTNVCKATTDPSCVAPSVWDPCNNICTVPTSYIIASPATPQAANIKINSYITAAQMGIGATSLSKLFEVSDSSQTDVITQVRITDSSGTQNPELQLQYLNTDDKYHWGINASPTGGGNANFNIWGPNVNANPLGAYAMTIRYDGNVGIGTENPIAKLSVNGWTDLNGASVKGASNLYVEGGDILVQGFNKGLFSSVVTSSKYCIGLSCITAWSQAGGASQWINNGAKIYYNGGNVGIGTNNPSVPLHVVGGKIQIDPIGGDNISGQAELLVNGRAQFGYDGSRLAVLIGDNHGAKAIVFQTKSSADYDGQDLERMRISSNGNVIIGFAGDLSDLYKARLAINMRDPAVVSGNQEEGLYIKRSPKNTKSYLNIVKQNVNLSLSPIFLINGYGQVGIGKDSAISPISSVKLDVSGDIKATKIALGSYNPDANIALTTPSAFAENAAFGLGVVGGLLSAKSGSVNAKEFCFNGDCKTSWSQVASQWTTSGANISNSNTGNVGIGTGAAAPSEKLEVNGNIKLTSAGNGIILKTQIGNNNKIYTPIGTSLDRTTIESAGSIVLAVDSNNDNSGNNAIAFYGDGTDMSGTFLMGIYSNGNVGIGTSAPAAKLDVSGSINSTALVVNGFSALGSSATVSGDVQEKVLISNGSIGLKIAPGRAWNGSGWVTDNNVVTLDIPTTKTLAITDNVLINGGNLTVGNNNSIYTNSICLSGSCKTDWASVSGFDSNFSWDNANQKLTIIGKNVNNNSLPNQATTLDVLGNIKVTAPYQFIGKLRMYTSMIACQGPISGDYLECSCSFGDIALSGGGKCYSGKYLVSSYPSGTYSWRIDCDASTSLNGVSNGYAVCLDVNGDNTSTY